MHREVTAESAPLLHEQTVPYPGPSQLRVRSKWRFLPWIIVFILVVGVVGASVVAAQLPDLRVTQVRFSPDQVQPGDDLLVGVLVSNRGRISAPATSAHFYLSTVRRRSSDNVLLTGSQQIPGLDHNEDLTGKLTVSVPRQTAAGRYFVVACVDDFKTILESNERNNCRASPNQVAVGIP